MPLDLRINGRPVNHTEARRLLETATVEDPVPTPTVTETVNVLTESGALREADSGSGRATIRIIEAGQGSSGTYPEDTLREAANAQIFAAGTPMFLDHPTASEGYERPERSVRDLAGRLTENARFEGGALVAEAEIFPHWRELIAGLAEHIGVSIRADGRIDESGTVREISRARSVDYVTEAGAGGRIDALVESARHDRLAEARNVADWIEVEAHRGLMGLANAMWGEGGTLSRDEWRIVNDATADAMAAFRSRIASDAPQLLTREPGQQADPADSPPMTMADEANRPAPSGDGTRQEEPTMSEATANAPEQTGATTETTEQPTETPAPAQEAGLNEALAARDERITALERQLAERDARTTVDSIVREAVDLPAQARQRAADSVDLDSEDLAEATRTALDAERTYVAEVRRSLGVGRVTGMGEAQTPTTDGPTSVEDYQKLGLSEADAKAAARIHA